MRRIAIRAAFPSALVAAVAGLVAAQPLVAQGTAKDQDDPITAERYVAPPDAIAKLVTAPREANVTFATPSPGSRKWFLRSISDGMPTLQQMGKAHYNLAGFQIDPSANRARTLTTRAISGLALHDWATGKSVTVELPAGARPGPSAWSPDGTQLAFLALFTDATQLWLADPVTGKARMLVKAPVLATNVMNLEWTADGKGLITVLVPEGRGAEPKEPSVADRPIVRINDGTKLKTRTYMDLLESQLDKDLLEYYTTGQLAVVDVKTKAIRKIGAPGMIRTLDASPDGKWFRVTYQEKPFSFYLPTTSFGTREVILDGTGKVVKELSKRPMREGESVDSLPPVTSNRPAATPGAGNAAQDTAKRAMAWHPALEGLMYLQLAPAPRATPRPAGDTTAAAPAGGNNAARRMDRLMLWAPPFDSTSAKVLYESANRITAARYSDDGRILFVTETATGGPTELAIIGTAKHVLIAPPPPARGAGRDSSANRAATTPAAAGPAARPGGTVSLVMRAGSHGGQVVMVSTDGKSVFAQGSTTDSTTKIARPWIDRIEIATGTRTRLYEGNGVGTETISAPLDDDFTRAVIQRESAEMVPQSFVLELATKTTRQLTQNTDVAPALKNIIKKTVTARRADGFSFKVNVTLPGDWKPGTKLPAMFWFYPREYDNQAAYDRGNATTPPTSARYVTYGARSMAFLTQVGYAVVEPDAPIFATEGQLPNDNYVVDLRNNLAATIDALDSLGYIDRHRLGIGGHSYGAFSTVNAMVHTPFFKAGIAGDGAYNRTLTPNGFQSEGRDLWQGRQTYLEMSPFLYADQLNGALLLYHSTEDQNVGTDPINSTKLFHALQGLGKTTSLYMYPYEDHGPVARETVLDQWARWVAWLDKYVKNANQPAKKLAS